MNLEEIVMNFRKLLQDRAFDHTNPSYESDRQLLSVYDHYFNIDTAINKIKPNRYARINEKQ